MVLAGRLSHFSTTATRLTKHLSTSLNLMMLLRSHAGYALSQLHQVFSPGRALLCRLFFNIMWAFFKLCRPTRPLTQTEPSPSDGQHACSRLSPFWPLIDRSRNRPPLPYPLALSGRLHRGLVGVFLSFCAVGFHW